LIGTPLLPSNSCAPTPLSDTDRVCLLAREHVHAAVRPVAPAHYSSDHPSDHFFLPLLTHHRPCVPSGSRACA
jgi:hypothetical protein